MTQIIHPSTPDLSDHSRFVQRLRRRYAEELPLLPVAPPDSATLQMCYDKLRTRFNCGEALRILRQLVFERLVVMDCCEQVDLSVITHAMTDLAEFSLDVAFCFQNFSNVFLYFGIWHRNSVMVSCVCVTQTCQHVRDRICHCHGFLGLSRCGF